MLTWSGATLSDDDIFSSESTCSLFMMTEFLNSLSFVMLIDFLRKDCRKEDYYEKGAR